MFIDLRSNGESGKQHGWYLESNGRFVSSTTTFAKRPVLVVPIVDQS
jgi:hypothetical protein